MGGVCEVWSGDGWLQLALSSFPMGLVWLSVCFRDALGRHQASRRNLSGVSNPLACDTSDRSPDGNGYCDGEHWQHGVLLSEHTISVPV